MLDPGSGYLSLRDLCHGCNTYMPTKLQRCGGCRLAFFCSKECQKENWPVHKLECRHNAEHFASHFERVDTAEAAVKSKRAALAAS